MGHTHTKDVKIVLKQTNKFSNSEKVQDVFGGYL